MKNYKGYGVIFWPAHDAANDAYKLYRHFVLIVAAKQKRLNDDLEVGVQVSM